MLLVIAALALFVWPWANQQTQELRTATSSAPTSTRVAPGQFQESASGTRVFFIDKDTPDDKSRQQRLHLHESRAASRR